MLNYRELEDVLNEPTSLPRQFLTVDSSVEAKILGHLQAVYKNAVPVWGKKKYLDNLIVKDFQTEQIWQQVELINEDLSRFNNIVATALVHRRKLTIPVEACNPSCHSYEKKEKEEDESATINQLDKRKIGLNELNEHDLREDELSSQSDSENELSSSHSKQSFDVNDRFFNLADMEKFVEMEESGQLAVSDEDVDYFKDLPSDDDSQENHPKYADFFADVPSKDETARNQDKLDSAYANEDYATSSEDDKESKSTREEDTKHDIIKNKSSFERRTENLQKRIAKLEETALQEKPWPLKGEVEASSRPINSLLEEVLEFDSTQRPAPVITEEVTLRLEDIITKRIKDFAFDDVERKIKPLKMPSELKKKIVLDQEKSKLSLAEIYEKEFLKQKNEQGNHENPVEELTEEKKTIDKLMKTLFFQLDVLSNFHFTPKLNTAELQIITNVPAIAVEEVAPVGMADSNLLAPGEVAGKFKRSLLGKDERTSTDKKRQRRKKKAQQRKKAKWRKEKGIQNSSAGTKTDKLEAQDASALKSSTKFFTKLQEEVHSHIQKRKRPSKNHLQTSLDAKKFKL